MLAVVTTCKIPIVRPTMNVGNNNNNNNNDNNNRGAVQRALHKQFIYCSRNAVSWQLYSKGIMMASKVRSGLLPNGCTPTLSQISFTQA